MRQFLKSYQPAWNRLALVAFSVVAFSVSLSNCVAAAPADIDTAQVAKAPLQRVLLSPLGAGSAIDKAGYKMGEMRVAPADIEAKLGQSALVFSGRAEGAGSKGDFTVAGAVPGNAKTVGFWAYLAPDANVESVGLQTYDAEGEALLFQVPANWTGWKWIELDLATSTIKQAYKQADKNSKADLPLRDVHIVWFARAAGPTRLVVNALSATTEIGSPAFPFQTTMGGADWSEPGEKWQSSLVVTNFLSRAATPSVEYSVQRVASLQLPEAPDPIRGSDHALGAQSWTEVGGETVERGSLTDGRDWTSVRPDFGPQKGTEAWQFVDLGKTRRITNLGTIAGDANWVWNVDISASADGKTYAPVDGLQNLDLHKKWGAQTVPVATPFEARFLRLRYHKNGEKVNNFAMFSALSVFDGVADENWELPKVGQEVARGTI